MNFYKYIVLEIQDMSCGELVKSLAGYEIYANNFEASKRPLQYYVNANDLMSLLVAKEIMEAALNSIYEVLLVSDELDSKDEYMMKPTPVYVDNFVYYNTKVLAELLNPNEVPGMLFKKLTKGRFQIVERFTSEPPVPIEVFEGDIS